MNDNDLILDNSSNIIDANIEQESQLASDNGQLVLRTEDLVKRYGNYGNILDDKPFDDIIEAILKEAINDGKGIEVNTSCYRYNLPDLTPSKHILTMYKDLGGEIITTGSDSHNPSQIAYKFDYIYSYLESIGFKYVCAFDKMKPQFIKI